MTLGRNFDDVLVVGMRRHGRQYTITTFEDVIAAMIDGKPLAATFIYIQSPDDSGYDTDQPDYCEQRCVIAGSELILAESPSPGSMKRIREAFAREQEART